MKTPTLRIGGLPPLQISPGTLVTLLILAVMLFPGLAVSETRETPAAILLSLSIAVFLIISVLVHEVAHAVAAKAFGGHVDHIALTLWGGHTQYRGENVSHAASIVISLAGPASNLLLAGMATGMGTLTDPGSDLSVFWFISSRLNLVLAVFNLLPGLPMDGGRAVESILGAVTRNRLLGTRITAWIGRAIAVAVVAWPVIRLARDPVLDTFSVLLLLWAMLIAGMLWQGASRALEAATLHHRIEGLGAAALAQPVRIVAPDHPLGELGQGPELERVLILEPLPGGLARPGPVDIVGRAHRIHPAAAQAVPAAHRAGTPASAVAAPVGNVGTLEAGLEGNALISAMLSHPRPAYLVRGEAGEVLGVILSADVNALLRGR